MGNLLVVDEAGMLDQNTARALLTVADEQQVLVGLVGDPRQLAAVGRGGVLEMAGRWAQRTCTLGVIHRFTHTAEIEPGGCAGQRVAVSVATNEQADQLNAAVRAQLVASGHVDDQTVATGRGGQRVGVGDRIACRANDRDLDVANRDTYTVTAVHPDGSVTGIGEGGVVGERLLPAGYVARHVQLGYGRDHPRRAGGDRPRGGVGA